MRICLSVILAATPVAASFAGQAKPFAGLRVEALAGYDITDPATRVEAASGALYGVGVGYDWQHGQLVAGPELELTGSSANVERPNMAGEVLDVTGRIGRSIFVGGRVGLALNESFVVYTRGGFVNTRFELEPGLQTADGGWRLGGGGEWRFARRLYLKAEYRFADYGREVRGQSFIGGFGVRFWQRGGGR